MVGVVLDEASARLADTGTSRKMSNVRVAVLVPCRDEEVAVARVIADFRAAIPTCLVYVYDNGSSDRTSERAREAGAQVRSEPRPGKGGVVRRMFAEVDADIYIMVDGDATYDASYAPRMIDALVRDDLDMVTAVRREIGGGDAYRPGHRAGNDVFNNLLGMFFGRRHSDMFSGYRALSRRFVKSFPVTAQGFEIETELTVHALQLRVPTAEIDAPYRARPAGSASKLRSYRDGARILAFMGLMFKEVRPFAFFGFMALVSMCAALTFGVPVILEFERTGLVPRLPTAVLATGLVLVSCLAFVCGLILDSVNRGRVEAKRLAYLAAGASRPKASS
jgi:glycosyltransferase involved in cell wall biosynthesis